MGICASSSNSPKKPTIENLTAEKLFQEQALRSNEQSRCNFKDVMAFKNSCNIRDSPSQPRDAGQKIGLENSGLIEKGHFKPRILGSNLSHAQDDQQALPNSPGGGRNPTLTFLIKCPETCDNKSTGSGLKKANIQDRFPPAPFTNYTEDSRDETQMPSEAAGLHLHPTGARCRLSESSSHLLEAHRRGSFRLVPKLNEDIGSSSLLSKRENKSLRSIPCNESDRKRLPVPYSKFSKKSFFNRPAKNAANMSCD